MRPEGPEGPFDCPRWTRAQLHEGMRGLSPGQQSWDLPHHAVSTELLRSDGRHLHTHRLVAAQGRDLNTSNSQTLPMCLAFLQIKLHCLQRGISWLERKAARLPVALVCQTRDDGSGFHS